MSTTPRLGITEMAVSQSNKYVTFNEALRLLEAHSQISVIDRGLSDAPASPADGDMYLIGASPTSGDDWDGHADELAYYNGATWLFIPPWPGMIVWVNDEGILLLRTNSSSPWATLYS